MKGILFDLDGTLVDTAIDMIVALKILASENGINIEPNYNEYKQLITFGSRAIVTSIFGHLEPDEIKALQFQYLHIYQEILNQNSILFAGMDKVIKYFDKHMIPWGIVTNKPAYLATPLVNSLPELANCGVLIGGDSTARSKPHPEPILCAIKTLSLNPQNSWYIGDALTDITAANAAHMNSAIALWGYLSQEDNPSDWQANKTLDKTSEILNLI